MKRLGMLIFLILFSIGCEKAAITVDGEKISMKEFEQALNERKEGHKAMGLKVDETALKRSVADELVANLLLMREARARKIGITEDELKKTVDAIRGAKSDKEFREDLKKSGVTYDIFMKRVRERLVISKLMSELIKDDSVTEDDMKNFYKKSEIPFLKPERVYVKIMEIRNEEDAKKSMEDLRKGADFDKLADELLKTGKAFVTGYDWLEPDTISKEIGTAMKTAKLNTPYGPYKGRGGSFYIFRITRKEPSKVLTYEEAKPQIKSLILDQRRRELQAHLVDVQRKKAKIKYNIKF